jgi:leader peptidase (prepilin peptidase)/N-methyltransferase
VPRALGFKYRVIALEAVLITIWIALLGLSIGSFLNVVIGRLPEEDPEPLPETDDWWDGWKATFRISGRAYRRLAWPPSRCPKCGHQLPWYENIPVFSWLALRGKCSGCKAPISPRYLLVELLTGALFVAATTRFPFDWALVSALTFLTFLIPLIFIDAELWILPFELTLPGIAGGVLLAIPQGQSQFRDALFGMIGGFLAFRAMEFFGWFATSHKQLDKVTGKLRRMGREALGAGDKYLLAMIGAQVGWRALLGVILFSSLQGSVVGLVRMRMTGRAGPGEVEPPKEEPPPAVSPEAPPPAAETTEAEDEYDDDLFPFTPDFLKPGLPVWKRLVLFPITIFFQDIPDSPPPDATTGEVPDWEPQANNIPFGPWIGLAGIEVMLLGPWIVDSLAQTPWHLMVEIIFGR